MRLIPSLAILSSAVLPCLAYTRRARATYDYIYNNPNWALSNTACSNGVNGLEDKWPTLRDVPNYPFVGGVPGLTWNSTLCGTCWRLDYDAPNGTINIMKIIAVDAAGTFNIAEAAFRTWAGSGGVDAGAVNTIATLLSPADCGIF